MISAGAGRGGRQNQRCRQAAASCQRASLPVHSNPSGWSSAATLHVWNSASQKHRIPVRFTASSSPTIGLSSMHWLPSPYMCARPHAWPPPCRLPACSSRLHGGGRHAPNTAMAGWPSAGLTVHKEQLLAPEGTRRNAAWKQQNICGREVGIALTIEPWRRWHHVVRACLRPGTGGQVTLQGGSL